LGEASIHLGEILGVWVHLSPRWARLGKSEGSNSYRTQHFPEQQYSPPRNWTESPSSFLQAEAPSRVVTTLCTSTGSAGQPRLVLHFRVWEQPSQEHTGLIRGSEQTWMCSLQELWVSTEVTEEAYSGLSGLYTKFLKGCHLHHVEA
jgi:hypothetical protein